MGSKAEQAPNAPWFLKKNEDGVFVKVDDKRVKNRKGHLMEGVVKIEQSSKVREEKSHVVITFKNDLAASGKTEMSFAIANFQPHNEYSQQFEGRLTSAKDFVTCFKSLVQQQSLVSKSSVPAPNVVTGIATVSDEDDEPSTSSVVSSRKITAQKTNKRKKKDSVEPEGAELPSPQKVPKPNMVDEDIEAHFIGQFNIKVASLTDCPSKWLDREIDEKAVDELVQSIAANPSAMHNAQPWLGIADVTKEDVMRDKNLIKGAKIYLIGGRHRHAAYKKVARMSKTNEDLLQKVWIGIYDHHLTDEQVCRLAAKHNSDNQGSRQTNWIERVASCRNWLFKLAKADPLEDEVPGSSTAWKKACQKMYMEPGKDVNGLEPTLQAALLPKPTYELLLEVSRLFDKGELKGMAKEKPSRRKKCPQLTQNQVGMPLQGLQPKTKDDLLRQVVNKQIALKEMRKAAERIKQKAKVVKAFLKFTGEKDWESLRKRFPNHATEEKMAQFNGVPLKRGGIPPVLESFFRRALDLEGNANSQEGVQLSAEKNGIFFFENHKADEGKKTGIMMEGSLGSIPLDQIKSTVTDFKGFHLSFFKIEKDTEEKDIKNALVKLHAANVDTVPWYNVVAFAADEDGAFHKCKELMEEKLVAVQKAYWADTRHRLPQGNLLQNSLHQVLIGHWSHKNIVVRDCCNFSEEASASNVFLCKGNEEEDLPQGLLASILDIFSFEGQWILDLTKSNGAGILAGLEAGRNVVSLEASEELRRCAASINAAQRGAKQKELADDRSSGAEEEEQEENEA